jgi:CHASE3 domain sensor protein
MKAFSIGQKLGAGFTVMVCLILLQGYASIAAIGNLGNMLEGTVGKASETSALVSDIQSGVAGMKSYAKSAQFAYALNGMLDRRTASARISCHPLPDSDKASHEFSQLAAGVRPKIQALASTGLSSQEKRSLDSLDESATEWVAVFRDFLAKASARQFEAGHSIITDRMEPIRERMEKATKELEAVEVRALARSQAESETLRAH